MNCSFCNEINVKLKVFIFGLKNQTIEKIIFCNCNNMKERYKKYLYEFITFLILILVSISLRIQPSWYSMLIVGFLTIYLGNMIYEFFTGIFIYKFKYIFNEEFKNAYLNSLNSQGIINTENINDLFQAFEIKISLGTRHYTVYGFFNNNLNINDIDFKFIFKEQISRKMLLPLVVENKPISYLLNYKGISFEVYFRLSINGFE